MSTRLPVQARSAGPAPSVEIAFASSALLAAYVTSVPLEGIFERYSIDGLGTMVVAGMVAFLATSSLIASYDRTVLAAWPLAGLCWWSAVTALWSPDLGFALRSVALQVYLVVPTVFALAYRLEPKHSRRVVGLTVIGLCAAVLFGLVRLLVFQELQFGGRLTVSASYNPSWLAAQAGLVVILSATMLADSLKRGTRGTFWMITGSISILGLLLTQGRNALLALSLVGLAALAMRLARAAARWSSSSRFVRSRLRTNLKLLALASILAVAGLVGLIVLATRYPDLVSYARLLQLTSGDASLATAGRTDTWRNYFWILGQSNQWLVGWGVWSAPFVYFTWFLDLEPPHNTFLSVLVELGVAGVALYFATFVSLAANTYRLNGVVAQGSRSVLGYAFLLSFGNDMLTYKYFWLTMTLSVVLAQWAKSADGRRDTIA